MTTKSQTVRRLPYPRGLKLLPDFATFKQHFTDSPKVGSIHLDPRISASFQFRLITIHEYIHLLHYPYRDATRQWLRNYLLEAQGEGRLPRGAEIQAPLFVPIEEHWTLRGQPRTLYERSDGSCMLLEMSQSDLLVNILAEQHDELLADFMAAAAAGVAFWTTLLDFEATSSVDRTHFTFARWELESSHTYDVHPIPVVRYRIFPEILARIIGQCALGPSIEDIQEVRAEMQEDFTELVLPRFGSPVPEAFSYRNERAPVELAELSLPTSLVRTHYEVAFEALSVLMAEWNDTRHPLALLTMLFHCEWLHRRSRMLAEQFRKRTPRPSVGRFDNLAGMAGARLCYDFYPEIDPNLLEIRSRSFLERVHSFFIPHPATSEA